MAVSTQDMKQGGDVVIHCKGEWTCCQREQAQAKVDNYNKNLPLTIVDKVSATDRAAKEICQRSARNQMDADMAANQDVAAKKYATSPCLAKQLEDASSPGSARSDMKLQMDHPVEVKVGGPATVALKALDGQINNFFGTSFAQSKGNKLREQGQEKIGSVSLVCNPPCKPPGEGDENKPYSTGVQSSRPPQPGGTVEYRISPASAWAT
jgi:hypothetical protein